MPNKKRPAPTKGSNQNPTKVQKTGTSAVSPGSFLKSSAKKSTSSKQSPSKPTALSLPATSSSSAFTPSQRANYTIQADETLDSRQQKACGFKPNVAENVLNKVKDPGDFRFDSTLTALEYSTGYHEAFAPTDFVLQLGRRTVAGDGTFTVPVNSKKYFKNKIPKRLYESNVKGVLAASDGARTDTAGTILSAPNGKAAGHSGSETSGKNQDAAHNLIRDQVVDLLSRKDISENAIAVAAAATVIASRAPADIARTADKADKLKAGDMRTTWERDRNEAKNRLNLLYDNLSDAEKDAIRQHMEPLMEKMSSKDGTVKRHLQPDEPNSPRRLESGPGTFQGGAYLSPGSSRGDDATLGIDPNADIVTKLLYVTQPFRVSRSAQGVPQSAPDPDSDSDSDDD